MNKYNDKVGTKYNYAARQRELRNVLLFCGKDYLLSTTN